MTPHSTWREQYDRMCRWQERIFGRTPIDQELEDDAHAFFTSCFHLKDWLKHDSIIPQEVRDKVERYLTGNMWLRLCADLANGSKHMVLDDRRRFDEDSKAESLLIPPPLMPVGAVLVVRLGETRYPVDRVVERCVDAWKVFLADHGLDTS